MIRKLMICPWFGPLPDWYGHWQANIAILDGYDFLLDTDLDGFRARAASIGVTYPQEPDPRKPCSYRTAFGHMYADEIEGYDWWGHTDLDCVYGRVNHFVTDELLADHDIVTDATSLSGPWTLYRNTAKVNGLYRNVTDWAGHLAHPTDLGFGENLYAPMMDRQVRVSHTSFQPRGLDDFSAVSWQGDRLMDSIYEVMLVHFGRTKRYPSHLERLRAAA